MTIAATQAAASMPLNANSSARPGHHHHSQTLFDQQLQNQTSPQVPGQSATPTGSFLSADMLQAIAAGASNILG